MWKNKQNPHAPKMQKANARDREKCGESKYQMESTQTQKRVDCGTIQLYTEKNNLR